MEIIYNTGLEFIIHIYCELAKIIMTVSMVDSSILVVDDDSDITWFFQKILEREGYSVETAARGTQALELAHNNRFDLAILDIMLPDIRGDQLAVELNKIIDRLKIIFVSGYPQVLEEGDQSDLNILKVMEKPVLHNQLIDTIKNALLVVNR